MIRVNLNGQENAVAYWVRSADFWAGIITGKTCTSFSAVGRRSALKDYVNALRHLRQSAREREVPKLCGADLVTRRAERSKWGRRLDKDSSEWALKVMALTAAIAKQEPSATGPDCFLVALRQVRGERA